MIIKQRFYNDNRAVSAVIGFILIFGMLMLALTAYQAQIVPQQNAQTEFRHFEEVTDDMIEIRSGALSAGQSDRPQYPTITMGTNYRSRLLTINAPPAGGTLQTSQPYPIKINGDKIVDTRFLEYEPGYNEFEGESIHYENSVLYTNSSDRPRIIESQSLVAGDGRLRITALQNKLEETGTGQLEIELYPTETSDIDFDEMEGEINITIPTRLDDHWNDTLSRDLDNDDFEVINDSRYGNDVFALEVKIDVKDVEINTVGIQEAPDGDTAKNIGQARREKTDDEGPDPPKTDSDNTLTLTDDDETFDVIADTEDRDVVFEGSNSEFLVEAGSDDPADMEGVVVFDEDNGKVTIDSSSDKVATSQEIFMRDDSEIELSGSDDKEARIKDDVTMGDDASVILEGAQIEGDTSVGSDSSIQVRAENDYRSKITGNVEVSDNSNVLLEASSDKKAVLDSSLTYGGDGKVEVIDSGDKNSEINGQIVIEDEDSTVEFVLESKDRFDDLDVVDSDGQELTEDDDQVEITT